MQYAAYKALNEVYEPVLDVPVVFIALRACEDLWKVRRIPVSRGTPETQ